MASGRRGTKSNAARKNQIRNRCKATTRLSGGGPVFNSLTSAIVVEVATNNRSLETIDTSANCCAGCGAAEVLTTGVTAYIENGRQWSPLCRPSLGVRLPDFAMALQQFALPWQQQQLPPRQQGQWHWQVTLALPLSATACMAWQWQPGSKCPAGLMQPDTLRPLIIAIGTIAQIIAARKWRRSMRFKGLPNMRHQIGLYCCARILRVSSLDVKAAQAVTTTQPHWSLFGTKPLAALGLLQVLEA
jgi:hypothetical protein